jgi:aminopeptidase N
MAVINFAKTSDRPVVDSVSSLMQLLNANSYQKGAWILHMLRKQVGDSAFHLFIKTYYDRYKGKNASTEDLETVAEETTHKELKQFFKQWLYTPGIPQLTIQWKYDIKTNNLFITVNQTQKQGPFQFPLEIKLDAGNKPVFRTLSITKQKETFTILAPSVVSAIYPDPNTSLLFEEKLEKLNP